jgi:hypothetical protein
MKKVILSTLLAAALAMTGCGHEDCDAGYIWNFDVKNETAGTIVFTVPGGAIALAPGETQSVNSDWSLGPCNAQTPMKDGYEPDDYIPWGTADTEFSIRFLGGEVIPNELMQRKHWEFEATHYTCDYTLTVTDKLLESL